MTTAPNPIDFALRVCESMAFTIHGILGMTEPWTGVLRSAFQDKGAMPKWFWPCAGFMLAVISVANFIPNDSVVLAVQAYIATFHIGASFYHLRIGHPLAVACVPLVLVLLAIGVAGIRTNFLVALVSLVPCAMVAALFIGILVSPPDETVEEGAQLLEE